MHLQLALALCPVLSQEPDATLEPLRGMVELYSSDRAALQRKYGVPMSEHERERIEEFHSGWLARLEEVDFAALSKDGRIDHVLLANLLASELRRLAHERARDAEVAALVPFHAGIVALLEARREMRPVEGRGSAEWLAGLALEIEAARARWSEGEAAESAEGAVEVARTVANRAAGRVDDLRRELEDWYRFYAGYDPLFTWWAAKPYDEVSEALRGYARFLREKLAGIDPDDADAIVGDPIGSDALLDELAFEMIPYAPEELVEIAESELAWCDAEMLRASRELGFDDDWRKAQDHVKDMHVEPGEQPELIRSLAEEAIDFLELRDLVTVPELAKETWRMSMMSPERQKVNPYFLGGEVIQVSFPTDAMAHADKLMSMRGNNVHFARATVHHELIPGHHLQQFMTQRYRAHRSVFRTPFWVEGWALYWEMLLWDLGFPRSPEDRVGMLFWRKHRCARIVFSLRFHLGEMTAQEAIDFLVEQVGHERNNATAEVRRSVAGSYGPLYQAAYMLGGLQLRALHRGLVESGRMTDREFHDAVLRNGPIPIAMVRAALTGEELARDHEPDWRFYEGR